MIRNEEALISQSIMSLKKTIYVEGNLDLKTVKCLLNSKNINNIKVVEINQEVDDSQLPVEEREISKTKIVSLIKNANQDPAVTSEYLGIIDLDYDYFSNTKISEPNLLYTDYNCIESYFINLELINIFLEEFNINAISESEFKKWISNSLNLSLYFFYQTSEIGNINSDNSIDFSKLSLCNSYYLDFKKQRLCIKNIVNKLTTDKSANISKCLIFLKNINRQLIYSNLELFLHGKHTLKYLICILKNKYKKIQQLSFDTIVCMLKDKFILNNFHNEPLFDEIISFSAK